MQLLVSESDVENYKQIKADLDELRLMVEKSELWVYKSKGGEGKKEKKKKGDDDSKVMKSPQNPTSTQIVCRIHRHYDSGFTCC